MDMDPQTSPQPEPALDRKLAYLVLRCTLGLSVFMHGLVRLPHLRAFANGLVKLFGDTPLPALLVRPFALVLVFVEAIVGLLVLLGLWTRVALIVGSAAMAALIFAPRCAPTGTRSPSSSCMPPSTPRCSPPVDTTLTPLTLFDLWEEGRQGFRVCVRTSVLRQSTASAVP
jgi:hypothetical protein